MKWIIVLIALVAGLIAGPAHAVPVDFSDLPGTDITAPNSVTRNGVTFTYDNFGSTNFLDFAGADSSGIYGSTYGSLGLSFNGPGATALSFDFAVQGVLEADPAALVAIFGNGQDAIISGNFTPYDPSDPSLGGDILGRLDFGSAAPFSAVSLLFSPVVDPGSFDPESYTPYFFSVSNIAYDAAPAPVPEPGSLVLLALGLAALGAMRSFRKNAE